MQYARHIGSVFVLDVEEDVGESVNGPGPQIWDAEFVREPE